MQLYLFEKVIFGFETLLFRATVMERVGTNHVLIALKNTDKMLQPGNYKQDNCLIDKYAAFATS